MLHRDSRLLILLLGALTAVGPFTTDTYLPSMPAIRDDFGVDMAMVQLTLSAAFFGGAIAQLFYGPLSDRFGRRPLLIAGLSLYVAASVGCLLADSIEELIWARFFQVFGSICAPVLARAMVRDLHEREAAARMLALMGMVLSLAHPGADHRRRAAGELRLAGELHLRDMLRRRARHLRLAVPG